MIAITRIGLSGPVRTPVGIVVEESCSSASRRSTGCRFRGGGRSTAAALQANASFASLIYLIPPSGSDANLDQSRDCHQGFVLKGKLTLEFLEF